MNHLYDILAAPVALLAVDSVLSSKQLLIRREKHEGGSLNDRSLKAVKDATILEDWLKALFSLLYLHLKNQKNFQTDPDNK